MVYISMIYSLKYDLKCCPTVNYPNKQMPTIQKAMNMVYKRMEDKKDEVREYIDKISEDMNDFDEITIN